MSDHVIIDFNQYHQQTSSILLNKRGKKKFPTAILYNILMQDDYQKPIEEL